MDTKRPLESVTILAVSQYGAGPLSTQLLSDLGAQVIKIESPLDSGDVGRRVPPLFTDQNNSLFFEAHNRASKSVALRLDVPKGQDIFRSLAAKADAVFHNLRGDAAERLGLTYSHLKDINEGLCCLALTGYGRKGEDANLPGYDYLFQGKAGWMSLTGSPDSYPIKSGLSLVDISAGMIAALAMVSGILRARESKIGGDIDVSLYDTALSSLGYIGTWSMSQGWISERLPHSMHPTVVPFQEFPTKDGHIVVACVKEKFFRILATQMGLEELIDRFPSMADRYTHRIEVTTILQQRFQEESTSYWLEQLHGKIPIEPVNTVAEALQDGEVPRQRGLLVEYEHPVLGRVKTLGAPIHGWWEAPPPKRAPLFAEHTEEVLQTSLRLSHEEIRELEKDGVIALLNKEGGQA
ncbi:CoA transferase [Alicyclobacillus tolerans]|uniref:CaiB/BaiF CoA transferase family protein n=1 Tax=Alicyclobacillus tolerans TaxID=90970 RepID=UPI001F3D9016|nr:CoA transferase [Alicyclobacillus tolerans]MCF8567338.1 CoA transferase [Alicyclobacillus tolerans]